MREDLLAAAAQAIDNATTASQVRDGFTRYLSSAGMSLADAAKAVDGLSEDDLNSLVGGHFNLTAAPGVLQVLLPSDVYNAVMALAMQTNVNYPGDNGFRYDLGDTTLHFSYDPSKGNITFHLDLYDPRSGFTGLLGHLFVDYLVGHIPGVCLDASCH